MNARDTVTIGRRAFCEKMSTIVLTMIVAASVSGCGDDTPDQQNFAPLSYSYLLPLRLNVANIEIDDSWSPRTGIPDVSSLSPVPPLDGLREMAQDRLVAAGNAGRAVLHIEDASILQSGDRLDGRLAVILDIYTSDGTRSAYAEARVARTMTDVTGNLRPALYTLTREMVDDMNVELEFQVRRSLRDWMLDTSQAPTTVPAPVFEQPLDQENKQGQGAPLDPQGAVAP